MRTQFEDEELFPEAKVSLRFPFNLIAFERNNKRTTFFSFSLGSLTVLLEYNHICVLYDGEVSDCLQLS